MNVVTEALANHLITRADKAHAEGSLKSNDHRQFITMVQFGLENQVLATRRNGNPSNGGWVQKRRTGEVQVNPALHDLLDAFPLWEWERAHGTYPDDVKWDAKAARWKMLTEKHGCAPTADIDREAYDWGREQRKRGRVGVGSRRAAILDTLPFFEWETTDGRFGPKPRASYSSTTAAQSGGTRWRPADMVPRRGTALPSPAEPACPTKTADPTTCAATSGAPVANGAVAVPSDPGFAADPHQWCRTHIAELMLREEEYTLKQIASLAGVSTVAVHLWLKDTTGMGSVPWRKANGWPTSRMSLARAQRIAAERSESPGEPLRAFANRLGISETAARTAIQHVEGVVDAG